MAQLPLASDVYRYHAQFTRQGVPYAWLAAAGKSSEDGSYRCRSRPRPLPRTSRRRAVCWPAPCWGRTAVLGRRRQGGTPWSGTAACTAEGMCDTAVIAPILSCCYASRSTVRDSPHSLWAKQPSQITYRTTICVPTLSTQHPHRQHHTDSTTSTKASRLVARQPSSLCAHLIAHVLSACNTRAFTRALTHRCTHLLHCARLVCQARRRHHEAVAASVDVVGVRAAASKQLEAARASAELLRRRDLFETQPGGGQSVRLLRLRYLILIHNRCVRDQ